MQGFNLSVLFLTATMPLWLGIIVAVGALAIGVALTFINLFDIMYAFVEEV